jgi:hypothetical protein
VLRLLLAFVLFTSWLHASKVLYISYAQTPQRVVSGEIIAVTYKSLSTVENYSKVTYNFSNAIGLKRLEHYPQSQKKGKYRYDTFHYLVKSSRARLPDVKASLQGLNYAPSYLKGMQLNVIKLNPPKNFSNIVAKDLKLLEYKTTNYDTQHNIVVFVLRAKSADLSRISFQDVYKQGIESLSKGYLQPKLTYFVVIDKRVEKFTFSYFNVIKNRYENISIPIIVEDDSVTTQTDLKPRSQSHDFIKIYSVAALSVLLFLFLLYKKRYIYMLILILPLAYIAYLALPSKEICVKAGANIYLLPIDNATVFETNEAQMLFEKEGSVKRFVKVKLQNDKIGWVKNEDTCSH